MLARYNERVFFETFHYCLAARRRTFVMVLLTPYRPSDSAESYGHFYKLQEGGELASYSNVPQSGQGLGGIFQTVARYAMPLLKKVGSSVGRQVLDAGASIARDVVGGANLKTSLKRRANEAGGNLLEDLALGMTGSLPAPCKRRKMTGIPTRGGRQL